MTSTNTSLTSYAPTSVTANCPTDPPTGYKWVAIAGGHSCDGWGVWIVESKQVSGGGGWTVKFDRDTRDARSCEVYAVCVLVLDQF
mgnify:FL=1